MGLVGIKVCRFLDYHFVKRFNFFVQFIVSARPQGDKSPNSTVEADTMKLLANDFCEN